MVTITLVLLGLLVVLLPASRVGSRARIAALLLTPLLGAGLAVAIEWALAPGDVIPKGPEEWWADHGLELGLYAAMLAGMLVKLAIDAFDRGRTFAIDRGALARAFLLSPVIFHVLYEPGRIQAGTLTWLVLSFQNGFFWHAVFVRREPEAPRDPSRQPAGAAGLTALPPVSDASPAAAELAAIRDSLVRCFADLDSARVLWHDAGLPDDRLEFRGTPEVFWHNALAEATRHGPDALRGLIHQAVIRYPADPGLSRHLEHLSQAT